MPEGIPAAKRELIRLFAAVQFFTCLPVPAWVGHSEEHLRGAIHYLPVIGLLVGCTGAATLLLGTLLWPPIVAVVASAVATILLTGALHEDGLADAMDGFGGVVVLMACLPYARATGASRARPLAQDVSSVSIAVAGLAGIAPLALPGAPTLGGAGAAAVVGVIWGLYLRRRLGGYTGDCMGAGQQLMELGFYLGAIARLPWPT